MREYKLINGNLLDAKADYICHQVNCQGKMNSGVAKAIRERYQQVYVLYNHLCSVNTGDTKDLLGNIQIIPLFDTQDTVEIREIPYPHYCINMFAQDRYGYDGKQYTSLEEFKNCLNKINEKCKNTTVAFPWLIGCVRGGADWNTVLPMICETLTDIKEIQFYKI